MRGLIGQAVALGAGYFGVTRGFEATAGAAISFESAFADVKKVVEANDELSADPALVNNSATGDGWLWKMRLADESQLEGLMDEAGYKSHIG